MPHARWHSTIPSAARAMGTGGYAAAALDRDAAARMEAAAGRNIGRIGHARRRARHRARRGPAPASARSRAAPACRDGAASRNSASVSLRSTKRPRYITATSLADVLHHREVVADEQIGQPEIAPQIRQQVEDLRLHRDIERAGRLVADHDARLEHQRARDRDALALPAGELRRHALAHLGREADALEHLRATRRSISPRANVPCAASGRPTMSWTRWRGLSEANGSWNTGWISRARALRSRSNRRCRRPARRPRSAAAGRGSAAPASICRSPNSPTMPSTLPAGTLKETSSTAITRFCGASMPERTRNTRRRSARPRSRRSCGLRLARSAGASRQR